MLAREVEPVHFFRLPCIPFLRYNKILIMKQLSILYKTNEHTSGLIMRITLASVMLPHGCQLLFGWFGGMGFSASMDYFTQAEGLPWVVGCMVILLQSLGSVFILAGFLSRFFAFAMTCLFIGMVVTSHWQHGFFMNWMGNQGGEGFEFHVLAIGLSLGLLASGSGAYSIDASLTKKRDSEKLSFDFANIYQ
jgi:putative oxidoreductase